MLVLTTLSWSLLEFETWSVKSWLNIEEVSALETFLVLDILECSDMFALEDVTDIADGLDLVLNPEP